MKWTFFVYLVITLSCAPRFYGYLYTYTEENQPANTVDFGTALQMYNVAIRNIMPCGYAAKGIPVLAPFKLSFYNFDVNRKHYRLYGNISNLIINGLDKVYFLDFSFNTTTNRTTYDIMFTDVQLDGEYMMDGWTHVIGFPIKLSGQGLLQKKISNFRLVGNFIMTTSQYNPNSLRISNFHLQFYIGDFVSNCWNYHWDIAENNFYNTWARAFLLMWSQQIQTNVDAIYAQLLLPRLNGRLTGVNMTQLINFFVEQTMEMTMASCSQT